MVKGTRFVKDLFDEFFQTDVDDTRDHSLETSPEEKLSVKTSYSQGQGEANKEAAENL